MEFKADSILDADPIKLISFTPVQLLYPVSRVSPEVVVISKVALVDPECAVELLAIITDAL